MIDRGDIRQAIDRCSNIWACRALSYGQFEHKRLTAWLQNLNKGRNGREIDVAIESPRLSPPKHLHHRLPRLLIITVDNAITYKAQRQKCQRNEAGERGNYWHADASAWSCCARCKIHEGVSWCCWKWCSAWWCCRWSSSVNISSLVSQCVKLPSPPAWIMQPPPDWQTPLNGIISPSERGWSLCKKQLGTQKYINEQCIELPISMGNSCNYCEQYTMRSASINA